MHFTNNIVTHWQALSRSQTDCLKADRQDGPGGPVAMAGPLRRRRRDQAAAATQHDARATGSHGPGDSQRRALLVDSNLLVDSARGQRIMI
jgi:hypothetical protein